MPAFDFSAYPTVSEGGGSEEEERPQGPSELESAGRGALQGASLGFADELAGALGSVFKRRKGESLSEAYKRERDESRQAYHEAEAAHPMAYGAGQIGGGLATVAVPGLGAMRAVKAGALLGGLGGLGSSEAQDLRGQALDVAKGAAFGGATGKVAEVAGRGLGYLTGKAADRAAESAVGGTTKAQLKPIREMRQQFFQKPGEFAQHVREQDIAGGFRGLGGVEKGAAEAAERHGGALGDVVRAADEAGTRVPVQMLKDRVSAATSDVAQGLGADKAAAGRVQGILEDLGNAADEAGTIGHGDLQQMTSSMASKARAAGQRIARGTATDVDHALVGAYGGLREGQMAAIEGAGVAAGSPGGGEVVRGLRRTYALDKAIERSAHEREIGLAGSHRVGLIGGQEALGGIGALALGHPYLAGGLIAKGLTGKATAPLRANLATSGLSMAQQALESGAGKKAGVGIASSLTRLATQRPDLLGRYAAPLQHAAVTGGQQKVAAAHYVLQTDPSYLDTIQRALSEPEESEEE